MNTIEAFLSYLSKCRSPKYALNVQVILNQWAKVSGIKDLTVSQITADHVHLYVNDPESRAKFAMRKHRLTAIRKFLEYCRDAGLCSANVAKLVEVDWRSLNHDQLEAKKVVPYERHEVDQIIAGIERLLAESASISEISRLTFWKYFVPLAFETGLRMGDIIMLEWDAVNAGAVHTKKTGARVTPQRIAEILSTAPRTGPRVFEQQAERYSKPELRATFSKAFRDLCRRIDAPYKGIHAFRHGAATEMAIRHGLGMTDIARNLGHANTKTTEGYVHAPAK